ncbi:MAG: TadE/TadG family type IV pilus assembly protein [Candidatus Dormibacteria bacterium]
MPLIVRAGHRGQAMVEFALLAPFFFVLLFMIFEGALFVNARATMDNATREGARAAAICGSSTIYSTYQGISSSTGCSALAYSVVIAHMGFLKIIKPNNPLVTTQCTPNNTCTAGNQIVVSSVYTYSYFIPNLLGLPVRTDLTTSASVVSQQ